MSALTCSHHYGAPRLPEPTQQVNVETVDTGIPSLWTGLEKTHNTSNLAILQLILSGIASTPIDWKIKDKAESDSLRLKSLYVKLISHLNFFDYRLLIILIFIYKKKIISLILIIFKFLLTKNPISYCQLYFSTKNLKHQCTTVLIAFILMILVITIMESVNTARSVNVILQIPCCF